MLNHQIVNGYTPVYTLKKINAYESSYVPWPEGFPILDCFDDHRPFHYTTQKLNSLTLYVISKLVLNPFITIYLFSYSLNFFFH